MKTKLDQSYVYDGDDYIGACRISITSSSRIPQPSPFENARSMSVCVKRLRAKGSFIIRTSYNKLP